MHNNVTSIFLSLCLLVASVCALAQEPTSQPAANQQKYQWVIEEILAQLKELKRDTNAIKRQIQGLGTQVEALAKAQLTGREAPGAPNTVALGSVRLGSDQARYAIVEFADYQCPYCARHGKNVMPRIKRELIDTGLVLHSLSDIRTDTQRRHTHEHPGITLDVSSSSSRTAYSRSERSDCLPL